MAGREVKMAVEIMVNWNLVSDGVNERMSFGTVNVPLLVERPTPPAEDKVAGTPEFVRVLPLRSSVIAPGFSMSAPAC
jgi:hypothetical protein